MSVFQARIYDALRWVAQEAKALKMSGSALPKGSRLREALDVLDEAYQKPEDEPAPRAEVTAYAVGPNGTRNRGFTVDGVRVLLSGDDDEKIARIAGDLSEAAHALTRAEARVIELQTEIDRQCKLNAQLSADVPPKRPAQIIAPGCVRFDEHGKLWLLSKRETGWSAWGVILNDWDDLFRRFNVRVTGHGTDAAGHYWEVTS